MLVRSQNLMLLATASDAVIIGFQVRPSEVQDALPKTKRSRSDYIHHLRCHRNETKDVEGLLETPRRKK